MTANFYHAEVTSGTFGMVLRRVPGAETRAFVHDTTKYVALQVHHDTIYTPPLLLRGPFARNTLTEGPALGRADAGSWQIADRYATAS